MKQENNENKIELSEKSKGTMVKCGILLCLIVAIIAVIKINGINKDYDKADDLYDATSDNYTDVSKDGEWYEKIDVDLEGLKKQNNDIVGWIFFENEDISYPVMCSEDNEKYFRTAYDGTEASAGSIFMESVNEPDFSDLHTILYGHNMKNLSMFGKLKYYKQDEKYYSDHKYFQIITDNKIYRYEIFSYKNVGAESDFYTVYRNGSAGFSEFVENTLRAGSFVNTKAIEVKEDDCVVSLSTCTADDDTRFVVSAVRVDEHERTKKTSKK